VAENLGAICIAFKTTYADWKSEIKGLFKTITNYYPDDVRNFYNEIKSVGLDYVAKIYGHPIIAFQEPELQIILNHSAENVRNRLNLFGDFYVKFYQLYNAYKHGYRLLLGKDDTRKDIILYISLRGKEDHVI